MPSRDETTQIEIPVGGLRSGYRAPPDGALLAQNLRHTRRGSWATCWGAQSVYADTGTGRVESMFWWASGTRAYLAWERRPSASAPTVDLVLLEEGPSGASLSTLASARSFHPGAWPRTQGRDVAGWLYLVNGEDAPIVTNGERVDGLGWTTAPAPPQVLGDYKTVDDGGRFTDWGVTLWDVEADHDGGAHPHWTDNNNDESARGVGDRTSDANTPAGWVYGYCVTLINERGMESPPSSKVWVRGFNDTAVGKRGVLLRLADPPAGTVAMRVWRTENAYGLTPELRRQLRVYLAEEITHGSTCQVCDLRPDSELGAELDEDTHGPVPRGAYLLELYKGTMWYATKERLYFSAPRFIEQVPELNYFPMREATALYATRDALVVFQRKGISIVRGDPVQGFSMRTLTEDKGCPAARGVVDVPNVGLLFVDEDGPMILTGALDDGQETRLVPLPDPLDYWQERVNTAALVAAQVELYRPDGEVWIAVPVDGSERPSSTLVFHYETGQWTERPSHPVNCMAVRKIGRETLFYGSHQTASPSLGVFAYADTDTVAGSALTSTYRSTWLPFAGLWERVIPHHVNAYMVGHEQTVTLRTRYDRADAWRASEAATSRDAENPQAAWGTATWSTGSVWLEWRPAIVVFGCGLPEQAFEVQYELSGVEFELLAVELEVTPGAPNRKRKVSTQQLTRETM